MSRTEWTADKCPCVVYVSGCARLYVRTATLKRKVLLREGEGGFWKMVTERERLRWSNFLE